MKARACTAARLLEAVGENQDEDKRAKKARQNPLGRKSPPGQNELLNLGREKRGTSSRRTSSSDVQIIWAKGVPGDDEIPIVPYLKAHYRAEQSPPPELGLPQTTTRRLARPLQPFRDSW